MYFPNFQNFDYSTGFYIVHTHYQFYEQGQENIFKLGFTYVNSDGTIQGSWYKDKDRIVLDCFKVINDGTSIVSMFPGENQQTGVDVSVVDNQEQFVLDNGEKFIIVSRSDETLDDVEFCQRYITIYNKNYYKFGYTYDNIALIDYIRHVVACYGDIDLSGTGGAVALSVKDESVLLSPDIDTVNFVGNLVTTTVNGTEAVVNINANFNTIDFFEYQSTISQTTHTIYHGKNTPFLKTDIYVYSNGIWEEENVVVKTIDNNTIQVELVEPLDIRVCGIFKNTLTPPVYNANFYEFISSSPQTIHTIVHNLNNPFIKTDIQVQDPLDGTWQEEIISKSIIDNNILEVHLSEPCNIKGFIVCRET
jgi:hypothetical protein